MTDVIKNIVIVGGGTAGWMVASRLSAKHQAAADSQITITLVESPTIKPVGVGEGTWPSMRSTLDAIGISEAEFIKECDATFKQGTKFNGWVTGEKNDSYYHPFVSPRDFMQTNMVPFWQQNNQSVSFADTVCTQAQACEFGLAPKQISTPEYASVNNYGYHLNAGKFADLLKKHCMSKFSVKHVLDDVIKVNSADNGDIASLATKSHGDIAGDLFIDCTGLAALLIEKTLSTGYDDWSHWLPCNRAMAVPCERTETTEPYTRSTAHKIGWQWRIPLQHRTGNGLVYSDKYMTDEEAKELLLNNLDGKPLAEPKIVPYQTGRRRKQWNKNVICIGLASGFFEPLESTNIHLIQTAAIRLTKFFPHNGINIEEVNEFNRQSKIESEGIRDFIILHYKLNGRNDSEFWRACQRMDVPESLINKIQLFKKTGKIFCNPDDLFTEIAWQQVMIGHDNIPEDHHPLVDTLTKEQVEDLMDNLKVLINRTVEKLPSHDEFLKSL